MTADKVREMTAGMGADAAVAINFLGLEVTNGHVWTLQPVPCPYAKPGCLVRHLAKVPEPVRRYSADIDAAWEVLRTFEERGWYWQAGPTPLGYRCAAWKPSPEGKWLRGDLGRAEAEADTLPLAVCRCALLACLTPPPDAAPPPAPAAPPAP